MVLRSLKRWSYVDIHECGSAEGGRKGVTLVKSGHLQFPGKPKPEPILKIGQNL